MENNVFNEGKIDRILEERYKFIQDIYLYDDKPWVIGYSGGKDSTVITDLILESLIRLPREKRHKHIFIISSDTMVENPMIESYVHDNIKKIGEFAKKNGLPVSSHIIKPETKDSFWVNLIGKGYPAPQQSFRWCTDRLKIKPANTFIKAQVDKYGEVIMVLGVRSQESHSRSIVMEKHKIEGKVLRKHTTLANALVFAPIEDFSTDDVWKYLLTKNPNTWGSDNEFLMSLYQDSQEGECPLMVDKEKPSCGNSRFGCWACTVVQEDKSLKGFIQTAKKRKDTKTIQKLQPLADLRNWLKDNRNLEEYRETKRQDGSIYQVETNEGSKVGLGSYKFSARKIILRKLLDAEKVTGVKLISNEELELIQKEWNDRLGDLENSVNGIYEEVYGKILFEANQIMEYTPEDLSILEAFCEEEEIGLELLKRLIRAEHKYYGLHYKNSLYQDFDSILHEDWLHKDEISKIKFGDADDN